MIYFSLGNILLMIDADCMTQPSTIPTQCSVRENNIKCVASYDLFRRYIYCTYNLMNTNINL